MKKSNTMNQMMLSLQKQTNKGSKLGRPVSIRKKVSILKSAQNLFYKKGFEGVTMDEIAKRAKVVKATLYNQFKDKETLFTEMMKNTIQGFDKEINVEEFTKGKTLKESLIEIGTIMVSFMESDEIKKSKHLMIMQGGRDKKLTKDFLDNGPVKLQNIITEILDTYKKRGVIKNNKLQEKGNYFTMILTNLNCFEILMNLSKKRDKKTIIQDVTKATNFFLSCLDLNEKK